MNHRMQQQPVYNRREFCRACLRGLAFGTLGGVAALLIRRRVTTASTVDCVGLGFCRRCLQAESCNLPRARKYRRALNGWSA